MRGCRSRNCAARVASVTPRSTRGGPSSSAHGRVRRQAAEGTEGRERQAQETAGRGSSGHARSGRDLRGKALVPHASARSLL